MTTPTTPETTIAALAAGQLPAVLNPEELAAHVLRIPLDEKHLAGLRGDAGLPHVRFRQGNSWFFRYPTEAVLAWIEGRTHTKKEK